MGHTTVDDGADLHTGVTAIVPSGLGPGRWTLPAAVYTGNGHGKLVGSTQVDELGVLESPVVLTATLSVFRAADALLGHLMERRPDGLSFNPLVGETNDGHLSDIRRRPITEEHVLAAVAGATDGLPAEGCVGAGAGTTALGYKAGIGTSSRTVWTDGGTRTVGALVQSNFGGVLTALGVPLPVDELVPAADRTEPPGNSCMIVVATDVPLDARQLRRLARRAVFAMARVGASFSTTSGDYAIASPRRTSRRSRTARSIRSSPPCWTRWRRRCSTRCSPPSPPPVWAVVRVTRFPTGPPSSGWRRRDGSRPGRTPDPLRPSPSAVRRGAESDHPPHRCRYSGSCPPLRRLSRR